jgi:hypothetical protein
MLNKSEASMNECVRLLGGHTSVPALCCCVPQADYDSTDKLYLLASKTSTTGAAPATYQVGCTTDMTML